MQQKQDSYKWQIVLFSFCVLLAISFRVIYLDSDPYSKLCWSTGLLTDEGFYIHNARNLILFGHERTDEFNNYLIMPTLHFVQVAVFRLFGVSSISARGISVGFSLGTLALFFLAMRRAFSQNVALASTLFLGLDHINLLYNRMALMDTPAAFLLVCAFYCFVRWGDPEKITLVSHSNLKSIWLSVVGLFLGLAFVTRGLTACVVPVPFVILLLRKEGRRAFCVLGIGLVTVLIIYAIVWYLPHREELIAINRHYIGFQLLPKTPQRLGINLYNGWLGDDRGFAPFLFRHTPVQFVLGAIWIVSVLPRKSRRSVFEVVNTDKSLVGNVNPGEWFLRLWLILALAMLSFVNYAPSRYYVIFYPALAGLSAIALFRMPQIFDRMKESVVFRTLSGAYFGYQLSLSILHHDNIWRVIGVGASTLVGGTIAYLSPSIHSYVNSFQLSFKSLQELKPEKANLSRVGIATLVLWGIINGAYTLDWLAHLKYTQRDASRWLTSNLTKDSVLIGDVAPGLCLDNKFECAPVIEGLCNARDPFATQRGHMGALIILDGEIQESFWRKNHPEWIQSENRIKFLPAVVGKPVGIYQLNVKVPPPAQK